MKMESKQEDFSRISGCMRASDGELRRAAKTGNLMGRRPSVPPKNLAQELADRRVSGVAVTHKIAQAMEQGDVDTAARLMRESGIRHMKGGELKAAGAKSRPSGPKAGRS